jgi:hypothetical protein
LRGRGAKIFDPADPNESDEDAHFESLPATSEDPAELRQRYEAIARLQEENVRVRELREDLRHDGRKRTKLNDRPRATKKDLEERRHKKEKKEKKQKKVTKEKRSGRSHREGRSEDGSLSSRER